MCGPVEEVRERAQPLTGEASSARADWECEQRRPGPGAAAGDAASGVDRCFGVVAHHHNGTSDLGAGLQQVQRPGGRFGNPGCGDLAGGAGLVDLGGEFMGVCSAVQLRMTSGSGMFRKSTGMSKPAGRAWRMWLATIRFRPLMIR